VSRPGRRLSATRLGGLLVALYPEPWRARYEEEVRGLLEDDPPSPRGLLSLLWGALDAHVRPQRSWRDSASPATRMRMSVGALFACWLLLSLAGIGFVKVTEGLSPVEASHPLLRVAHVAIGAGAVLGALAIAVGGLPLVWQALVRAVREREARLILLLCSPVLAAALLAGFTLTLGAIAPSRQEGFPASFVLAFPVPLMLAGLAFTLVCGLAPKAVMRRTAPDARMLRRACLAGLVLAGAMIVVTAGLALYAADLWGSSLSAGAPASGPFGASVRMTLCLDLIPAALALGAGLVAARRALRAATIGVF
jgi:hypothetical protein